MLGLVIAVVVPAASAHDNTAGIALLDGVVDATGPGAVTKARSCDSATTARG